MDREHSDLNLDTEGQPSDKPKLPWKIIQLRRASQKNHVRRMKTAKLAKQTNLDPSSLAQTVHNKTFRSFLQSSSSAAHSAAKPVGAGECPSSKERSGNSGMPETDDASACEGPGREPPSQEGTFECNICIDTAQDEVVTPCGHLFCWPCLQRWMEIRPHRQLCPVCKAVISKESVIHVYGRGASKQHSSREDLPRRPPVKRTKQRSPVRQASLAIRLGAAVLHRSPRIGGSALGNSSPSFASGRNRPGPVRGTRGSGENMHLLELLVCGALGVVLFLLSVLGKFWDEE